MGKIFRFFRYIFRALNRPIIKMGLFFALISLIFGVVGGMYIAPWLKNKIDSINLIEENNFINRQVKTIPEVVKSVSPSVVSIIVSKYVPILEKEYYNPFGENSPFRILIPRIVEKGKELKEVGGGTGFVVSEDGLIVTNKHVVIDTSAEYTVLTNDGSKFPAKILIRSSEQDVAILKINTTNLQSVRLGNSDRIEIGQSVIAIGNALGEFRNTVSSGIISGLMRSITAGDGGGFKEKLDEVIQTDAAINSGNSGGPLLNLYGEVIGINTAVAINAENIGFAIPINKIKQDIFDAKNKGK
ncbi:MAG: trypsin-like peptidase domain-containing protein [Patescibacteria group bacterium]